MPAEVGAAPGGVDLEDSVESGKSDRGAAMPPRIDSVIFARQGESLGGRLALSGMSRLLAAGVAPEGEIEWQVRGFSGLDDLQRRREFLQAQTRFAPWMTCSKCLEPVQVHGLASNTRFRLAATEKQAEQEDRESETDEVIAADPGLDLAALVEDEAILALPMAPTHPDCVWDATVSAGSGDV